MRQIIKRLERLEQAAGMDSEQVDIIIEFVGIDKAGEPFVASGLRMIPGSRHEQLPASFFNKEEIHHEA